MNVKETRTGEGSRGGVFMMMRDCRRGDDGGGGTRTATGEEDIMTDALTILSAMYLGDTHRSIHRAKF